VFFKYISFQNCNTENYCLQVNEDALKLNAVIKIIKHNMNILTPKNLNSLTRPYLVHLVRFLLEEK